LEKELLHILSWNRINSQKNILLINQLSLNKRSFYEDETDMKM
jgi:hypothetical protein